MHPDVQIGNDLKLKPEPITFYNKSKYGVDVVNQMARKYSVKSASRRWPVHAFFNVLDFAWVLYKETTKEEITRRDFLFKLTISEELTSQHAQAKTVPASLLAPGSTSRSRRRCQIRKSCKDNV